LGTRGAGGSPAYDCFQDSRMQVTIMERLHGHVVAGYAEKPDVQFATAGGNEPGT
jgi:hypothetical protein